MKTDIAELKLIADVINGEGFKAVEKIMRNGAAAVNNVMNVTGHPFDDGKLVGRTEQALRTFQLFHVLREECKTIKEE